MRRMALVLVGVLLALAGCGGSPTTQASALGFTVYPAAGRTAAPALSGDLLSGGTFDLTGHRGDVVVINFWASWCGPCVLEAPDFEAVYQETRRQGVTFLGVNTRDTRDAARAFLVGRETYPSIFDPAGRVALGFDVPPSSTPSTVIIDRQGRVAASIFGYTLRDNLEPVVRQIAAEST